MLWVSPLSAPSLVPSSTIDDDSRLGQPHQRRCSPLAFNLDNEFVENCRSLCSTVSTVAGTDAHRKTNCSYEVSLTDALDPPSLSACSDCDLVLYSVSQSGIHWGPTVHRLAMFKRDSGRTPLSSPSKAAADARTGSDAPLDMLAAFQPTPSSAVPPINDDNPSNDEASTNELGSWPFSDSHFLDWLRGTAPSLNDGHTPLSKLYLAWKAQMTQPDSRALDKMDPTERRDAEAELAYHVGREGGYHGYKLKGGAWPKKSSTKKSSTKKTTTGESTPKKSPPTKTATPLKAAAASSPFKVAPPLALPASSPSRPTATTTGTPTKTAASAASSSSPSEPKATTKTTTATPSKAAPSPSKPAAAAKPTPTKAVAHVPTSFAPAPATTAEIPWSSRTRLTQAQEQALHGLQEAGDLAQRIVGFPLAQRSLELRKTFSKFGQGSSRESLQLGLVRRGLGAAPDSAAAALLQAFRELGEEFTEPCFQQIRQQDRQKQAEATTMQELMERYSPSKAAAHAPPAAFAPARVTTAETVDWNSLSEADRGYHDDEYRMEDGDNDMDRGNRSPIQPSGPSSPLPPSSIPPSSPVHAGSLPLVESTPTQLLPLSVDNSPVPAVASSSSFAWQAVSKSSSSAVQRSLSLAFNLSHGQTVAAGPRAAKKNAGSTPPSPVRERPPMRDAFLKASQIVGVMAKQLVSSDGESSGSGNDDAGDAPSSDDAPNGSSPDDTAFGTLLTAPALFARNPVFSASESPPEARTTAANIETLAGNPATDTPAVDHGLTSSGALIGGSQVPLIISTNSVVALMSNPLRPPSPFVGAGASTFDESLRSLLPAAPPPNSPLGEGQEDAPQTDDGLDDQVSPSGDSKGGGGKAKSKGKKAGSPNRERAFLRRRAQAGGDDDDEKQSWMVNTLEVAAKLQLDTSNPRAAIRSRVVVSHRITSELVSHLTDEFTDAVPGVMTWDQNGERVPLYQFPLMVNHVAAPIVTDHTIIDVTHAEFCKHKAVNFPYLVTNTPADGDCEVSDCR